MRIAYDQLDFIDEKLRNLMDFAESIWPGEPVITSLYRMNDSGVHGALPLRGCDLRTRDFDTETAERLAGQINAKWTYDTTRPVMRCAIFHDVGQGAHIHLQVHPRTVQELY